MYIQKVKLQNFRSFGDEGICFLFNKGINAVIGENNNGKTALIDAIRIAFSCVLYKKDIFFSKTDFHVNAAGERAAFAQIDVYLKDVPQNLIEIWDPIQPDCGEFHVVFTLEKTAAGTDKVKYRAWGGKCEGNLLSSDTLEAINLDYLSALRDASSEMKPSRNSKLAELLETIAKEPKDKEALVDKLRTANQEILQTESLGKTKQVINENLFSIEQDLMYQKVDLGLVEPRFESITASLRTWIVPRWCFMGEDHQKYAQVRALESSDKYKAYIHDQECGLYIDVDSLIAKKEDLDDSLKDALVGLKKYSFEIFQNGLGYNNLLFISAVLGDMSFEKSGIYENVFLVEEPEAHLHPQLQELILNFFMKNVQQHENIQVIMTSHTETGLMLSPNETLQETHRHFSHAMAIEPLCMLRYENPQDRSVIDATVDHLVHLGSGQWVGFSFGWMALLQIARSNGNGALYELHRFAEHFLSRNGFHLNGDYKNSGVCDFHYRPFTLEADFLAAHAVQKMLLRSEKNHIEVLPACPQGWKNEPVAFQNLRAENGLLISYQRTADGKHSLTVKATQDGSWYLCNTHCWVTLQAGQTQSYQWTEENKK